MRKVYIGIIFLLAFSFIIVIFRKPKPSEFSYPLKPDKIADIPLSGGADRFDYQSINYDNDRLYISHLGSGSVVVFDLKNQKIVKTIENLGNPYGILVAPELKKVYVSEGGTNQVAVIDEETLEIVKHISVGKTPDGIAFDTINNKVFVSNENDGTVSVINGDTNEFIENITVGDSVGNTHYDSVSKLIYTVSGKDNNLIEINPENDNVTQKYALPDCSNPHGFFLEEETHYALISCQGTNNLVVFDLNNKKIIAKDDVGRNPDVLAYDPSLHYLYVAAESGDLTVFKMEKDKVVKSAKEFIANKAHTVSIDSRTHYAYFPLENVNGKPVLRILKLS